MLKLEPTDRPSIEEIEKHSWITGPTPSYEDIVYEIESRQKIINEAIINSMEKKA
jgi:hypothetical protein